MDALEKVFANGHPAVIAHRGSSRAAPENTSTAIELAAEEGADAVEFDVRLTKDGLLVVMHDARLGRTVRDMHLVSELTADEVASLDAGKWLGNEFRGEVVPFCDEILSTLRRRSVPIVEIKDGGETGVKAAHVLIETLTQEGMVDEVLVASGHPEALEVLAEELPGIPRIIVAARRKTALAAVASGRYSGCFVWWKSFSSGLVEAAHANGVFVAPWVVPNDKVSKVVANGADAILTDEPLAVLESLRSAGCRS